MKAIGIDLGTTNSLVAVVHNGEARALPDAEGRAILPSAVAFGPDNTLTVGHEARAQAHERPGDTVVSVKRLMGRTADEAKAGGLTTLPLLQDGAVLRVGVGGGWHTPVEISARILEALLARARGALGEGVLKAVITVPAYFDDAQRNATRQAGALAGLDVMRLLNEPTAAALAYGLEKRQEGRFAIFDLGGGTFDISILHLVDGVFEVLSTGGDTQLGGDDLDRLFARTMLAEAGLALADVAPGVQRRALDAAERVKMALTDHFEARFQLDLPAGGTFSRALSRDQYQRIVQPVLDRVVAPCRQALSDAGLRADEIDGVVLVGGSTRSPIVQRLVVEIFGQKPLCDIDPDQVVALGAASQADLLSIDSELRLLDHGDVLLLDVIPLSLGLETMGGVVEKIIPRNSQIPASRAQEFTTFQDGQDGMDVHVLQGERELADDCRSLARFRLTGIPPRPAGAARVRVTFQVDADGILQVSAEETTTGVKQSVEVRPSHGLTDAEVEQMLQDSLDHAEEDVMARVLRTAQVEAERVLMPLRKALEVDADLVTVEERGVIGEVVADLEAAMIGTDHRAIEDLTQLLDKVSGGFAQRRMERALQAGLRDVKVETLEAELADAPIGGGKHD
ncbi:MAG: Fe-S protein assembly chaperone HscA [Myxococcales bacterium]|nr:Fe-S protein assembly chaperone HscA [Myxococcales bacterium]